MVYEQVLGLTLVYDEHDENDVIEEHVLVDVFHWHAYPLFKWVQPP